MSNAKFIDDFGYGGVPTIVPRIAEHVVFNKVFENGFPFSKVISLLSRHSPLESLKPMEGIAYRLCPLSFIPDLKSCVAEAIPETYAFRENAGIDAIPDWLVASNFTRAAPENVPFIDRLLKNVKINGLNFTEPRAVYYTAIKTWWNFVSTFKKNPSMDEITNSKILIAI